MSGLPRFGQTSPKQPALPKRQDTTKTDPDVPASLPTRNEIRVVSEINKNLKPLARVTKKFQVAGQPTLLFEVDDYMADCPYDDINIVEAGEWGRQAIQCCLHEMMHMALWDDVTISHNPDKASLLYYYVDGSNQVPTQWDLDIMKTTAKRIGSIIIEIRDLKNHSIGVYLHEAARLWNEWIGRNFFTII